MTERYNPEVTMALSDAFGFDDADLNTNRQGSMTAKQTELLVNESRGCLLLAIPVSILVAGIGIIMLANTGNQERWVGAIVIALAVLLVAWLVRGQRRATADIRANHVDVLDGLIRLDHDTEVGSLVIEGMRFDLSPSQFEVLAWNRSEHGIDHYFIYYAPQSKQILSLEPLLE